MDHLNKVTQKFGIKINEKKKKVMCKDKDRKIKVKICINRQMLEQAISQIPEDAKLTLDTCSAWQYSVHNYITGGALAPALY